MGFSPVTNIMAVELSDFSTQGTERQLEGNHPIPVFGATVAAFLGRTQRGPLNSAVQVGSFEEFRRIFGGHVSFSYVSHSVQQFFQHGGSVAVVARVANRARRATLPIPAGEQVLHLEARDPGAHSHLRASIDIDGLRDDQNRFNLVVQRLARPGSQLVEDQEIFHSLSMDTEDKRFIVDILKNSELVTVARPLPRQRPDVTRATHPGQPIPYVEMNLDGFDGEELTDYDIVGSNDNGTGMFALDSAPRVDLLCVPAAPSGRDLGITTFLAAERYCENRKAMLIWDAPKSWSSPETALIGLRDSSMASQNVMTYYPRVTTTERSGRIQDGIPACGVVAGLLSQNDRAGVWNGLAGGDVQLKAGLSVRETLSEKQISILQRNGVNVFGRSAHGSYELRGDVTLAGTRLVSQIWQRSHRRRLAFFVLSSIERHTAWAAKRPRDDKLWQDLTTQVTAFLTELFEHGAFAGRTVNQAFSVKTGPALQLDTSELILRVGFALERPGEFQSYDIIHSDSETISQSARSVEIAQLAG
jgi:hypothetical protein